MRSIRFALLMVGILSLMLPSAVLAADIIHTVQPGENLYRIGLQYGVSWQTLMTVNGLSSSRIFVGQQIKIPDQAAVMAAPADPAPVITEVVEVTVPADLPELSTYVVARGDTLGAIAQRFGTTVSALVSANHLTNPNRIFYGQTLSLTSTGSSEVVAAAPVVNLPSSVKEIQVDISEQRMRVYENGALIWDWVTSTGEPGADTRPGSYSVLNKIPNAYGATWNLWMPNWLGIYWAGYLQNGIHSLPILSDGSKLWAGFLGTPVSFGCVILDDTNSALLYNWAELGTPVIITY
jgi:LysM repeat protein